jgi:UDP-N-acetylglucosamine 2-epimerase (non-hydrolysing)
MGSPCAEQLFLYSNERQRQLASLHVRRHVRGAEPGRSLSSQRIDLIIGTRPEAIKLAPVAAALAGRGLAQRLILTGQHPLSPAEHGLEAYERIELKCPGGGDPHHHVGQVALAVAPLLADRPALLIVQGDTSSALGGAKAGFAAAIPIAHVEAGLRSFDPVLPWPEEEFRTAIDAGAALLFAPTEISAANLDAEGVSGQVFVTGNTGIDALLAIEQAVSPGPREGDLLKLLVTCHRRESWGAGLRSIAEALIELAASHPLAVELVLHPNPQVAGAMRELLEGRRGFRLVEPLAHGDMVAAMQGCDILLSDSGGMQEEAPALGVPMLVLRDKTERPEGVASGNMLLVGTDKQRIVENVGRLLDPTVRAAMSRRAFPFGDGRSATRIAGHIAAFLEADENELDGARRA